MEKYLINTVKIYRRRCYSYISSRIGLFHLCSSPLFYNQGKTSALKDNAGPNRSGPGNTGEERRAIIHENTCYTRAVSKAFDVAKEMTKLNSSHEPRFRGKVVIPPRERALTTTENILQYNAGRRHPVFFVDGSTTTTPKFNPGLSTTEDLSAIPSGAAVVSQPKKDEHWNVEYFTPVSRGRDSVFTELAAIAHGLTTAMVERALYLDENKRTSNGKGRWSQVTIFSDCTSALQKICKLRDSAITDAQLLSDPTVRQIITVSQYLCDSGVDLELRWVPGHSQIEGNRRANVAARYAARHQEVGTICRAFN